MLPPALRALLSGAIDYAGLFPPAALDMATAVRNYEAYRRGPDAWALGRFVVPAARLDEFIALRADSSGRGTSEDVWNVSAILGNHPESDLLGIRSANQRLAGRAVIDSIEVRASAAADAEILAPVASAGDVEVFVEIPLDRDIAAISLAVSRIGAWAKIRTGGVTREAFPSAAKVAHFLRTCHARGIGFKATAGLHHPIRASYRLTYQADSGRAEMFGFLNVLVAALLVWKGEDEATVTALLEERSVDAIAMDAGGIRWQAHVISPEEIGRARRTFIRGFGSCSFREPLDELSALVPVART